MELNDVIYACIILHNMIVEGEWHYLSRNHDFAFQQDDGTRFQVDRIYKNNAAHLLGSIDVIELWQQYMNGDNHNNLKLDLIEHLWETHGNND